MFVSRKMFWGLMASVFLLGNICRMVYLGQINAFFGVLSHQWAAMDAASKALCVLSGVAASALCIAMVATLVLKWQEHRKILIQHNAVVESLQDLSALSEESQKSPWPDVIMMCQAVSTFVKYHREVLKSYGIEHSIPAVVSAKTLRFLYSDGLKLHLEMILCVHRRWIEDCNRLGVHMKVKAARQSIGQLRETLEGAKRMLMWHRPVSCVVRQRILHQIDDILANGFSAKSATAFQEHIDVLMDDINDQFPIIYIAWHRLPEKRWKNEIQKRVRRVLILLDTKFPDKDAKTVRTMQKIEQCFSMIATKGAAKNVRKEMPSVLNQWLNEAYQKLYFQWRNTSNISAYEIIE